MSGAIGQFTPAEIARYYSSRAPGIKRTKAIEWRGPCPVHGGTRDNFAINTETGQAFCHSECGKGWDILSFEQEIQGVDFKSALANVSSIIGRTLGEEKKPAPKATSKRTDIVATYDYKDETGTLLFQCVRMDPKGFSQRRPDGKDGWVWKMEGVRRVLYRLPEVIAADEVYLVEGEKDADSLAALGFVATTSPMGAGKWKPEYALFLKGKRVVLIPDQDEPGRKHAADILRSLRGVAESIRVIELPHGKDVSEWIEQGGTAAELLELPYKSVDQAEQPEDTPDEAGGLYHNDTGNANRVVKAYGADLAYYEERKAFMLWTGSRWKLDRFVEMERITERVIVGLYAEVSRLTSKEDEEKRDTLLKFISKSLSRAGIANAVDRCRPKLRQVTTEDFDQKPYLLNFKNGTLDLRNNKLGPHRREDFITKQIPYNYDPAAKCPTFDRFLRRIMGDGPAATPEQREKSNRLISYLQTLIGCALTGKPEKLLAIFYGSGNNGKTTFIEIIRDCLGGSEYAGQIQIDSLMTKAKEAAASNAINADLASLQGCRFVSASEPEKGSRLSVARVKYLTGMGEVKARYLRENQITFKPTHKIFIDCNDKPVITDPNDTVWNRVKLIPFTVEIPKHEIDTTLGDKMRAELPGIMAWFAKGAAEYLRNGLQDIPEVSHATEEYRLESDKLGEFLEDCCAVNRESWVAISALWEAYNRWAEQNGDRYPLGKNSFDERILKLGCRKVRRMNGTVRAWEGIALK